MKHHCPLFFISKEPLAEHTVNVRKLKSFDPFLDLHKLGAVTPCMHRQGFMHLDILCYSTVAVLLLYSVNNCR